MFHQEASVETIKMFYEVVKKETKNLFPAMH